MIPISDNYLDLDAKFSRGENFLVTFSIVGLIWQYGDLVIAIEDRKIPVSVKNDEINA